MDIPISLTTLISGNYKILTGTVGKAGWTGPVYPSNTKTDSEINTHDWSVNSWLNASTLICKEFVGALTETG